MFAIPSQFFPVIFHGLFVSLGHDSVFVLKHLLSVLLAMRAYLLPLQYYLGFSSNPVNCCSTCSCFSQHATFHDFTSSVSNIHIRILILAVYNGQSFSFTPEIEFVKRTQYHQNSNQKLYLTYLPNTKIVKHKWSIPKNFLMKGQYDA